jgi:cystathionine beta-lyase/cystathionine gamma-synthase
MDDLTSLLVEADRSLGPLTPVIDPASTFAASDPEDFAAMASEPRHSRFYTRYGNPTHRHAETLVAAVEGAETAQLFASGMAAVSAAALSFCAQGDHLVLQRVHYGGVTALATELLPRLGIEVTAVDQRDTGALTAAIGPRTRLVLLETPSNPLLLLTDLPAVAAAARAHGAVTMVDSTLATPVNQRPLEHGIDLVLHSATKYLGGHGDLTAGVIAGSEALLERIWRTTLLLGATSSPFDAWLLARGLRTLALRVERGNTTAQLVAEALEAHPAVTAVHYPGLPSHPQHALARRQMPGGFGGLLSFEVAGGYAASDRVVRGLRRFTLAASLGGVHSLVTHPAAMMQGVLTPEQLEAAGVRPALIRLAIGLESPGELIADLQEALG